MPNGERVQRSTKEPDKRRAEKIAAEWEAATRRTSTARQMQKVVGEMYRRIMGDELPASTVGDYLRSWLERKRGETTGATLATYRAQATRFLGWLGNRAGKEIATLTTADVLAFRAAEHERVSAATVNHGIKFLRMVFEQAKRDGLIAENPAEEVKTLKRADRTRRGFTLPELKTLLAEADDEWRSLIIFGLYTGQRLGDLARLTWQNIDLDRNELRLVTSKTGRQQIIPLTAPLRGHIDALPAGDDPRQPIHARAFASVAKSGKVGTLSRQFYELMAHAGLVVPKKHRASAGDGKGDRRTMSEISFHGLRHTATSLLKNAGVSPAIVQDIIGHESEAISANYTHIEESAKRSALSLLPDLTKGAA
jgi:integrase